MKTSVTTLVVLSIKSAASSPRYFFVRPLAMAGIMPFENLEAFRSIYNYGSRGDAVTLYNKDGKPYHTLIIVDYDKGDLICASHS
ncbi:MAG: hypothetical protein RR444_07590, partial [Oscillospiraceae bacterium]